LARYRAGGRVVTPGDLGNPALALGNRDESGTAIVVRIAATLSVTISSISVKPRTRAAVRQNVMTFTFMVFWRFIALLY